MNNTQTKELCLSLMKADTEDEVVALLKKAGYCKVDPCVKTQKWGRLRCGWPFSSPEK